VSEDDAGIDPAVRATANGVLAALASDHQRLTGWPVIAAIGTFVGAHGQPICVYTTSEQISMRSPVTKLRRTTLPLNRIAWGTPAKLRLNGQDTGSLTTDFTDKWAGYEHPAEILVDYAHTLGNGHARLVYLATTDARHADSPNHSVMPPYRYLDPDESAWILQTDTTIPRAETDLRPLSRTTTISAVERLEQIAELRDLTVSTNDLHECRARMWAARWERSADRPADYTDRVFAWLYTEACAAVRADDLLTYTEAIQMYVEIAKHHARAHPN
jgi:hypothetical protein